MDVPHSGTLNTNTFLNAIGYDTLDAPDVGAVDTVVLRFAANAIVGDTIGIIDHTNANNGTIVAIQRPGAYLVSVSISKADIVTPAFLALTQDCDAAALTANVAPTIAGKQQFQHALDTDGFLSFSAGIVVGGAQAAQVATAAAQRPFAGSLLRLHCNDGAGGAAVLTAAEATWQIQRVNGIAL